MLLFDVVGVIFPIMTSIVTKGNYKSLE